MYVYCIYSAHTILWLCIHAHRYTFMLWGLDQGPFLHLLSKFIFGDSVSQWIWSSWFQLGWLANELQGSMYLCLNPTAGLQEQATIPGKPLVMGLRSSCLLSWQCRDWDISQTLYFLWLGNCFKICLHHKKHVWLFHFLNDTLQIRILKWDFNLVFHFSIFKRQKVSRAVVAYTFNPSTREAEAGGSLWGQPSLHSKFQDRLQSCTEKPCLKKPTNQINKKIRYRKPG